MTVHTIRMPDWMRGDELRAVVWDDEAGTVEGDHYKVPELQEDLAQEPPLVLGGNTGPLILNDPRHDPRDFLALLGHYYWPILTEPNRHPGAQGDRHRLPPALRNVEHRRFPSAPDTVQAILPDGSMREYHVTY